MPRHEEGPVTAWLSSLSDAEMAYAGGTALALLIVVAAIGVLALRSCKTGPHAYARRATIGDVGPARADEYDTLQVLVQAHNQEAELEVQTDAWDSFEEVSLHTWRLPLFTMCFAVDGHLCTVRLVNFYCWNRLLCVTVPVPGTCRRRSADNVSRVYLH